MKERATFAHDFYRLFNKFLLFIIAQLVDRISTVVIIEHSRKLYINVFNYLLNSIIFCIDLIRIVRCLCFNECNQGFAIKEKIEINIFQNVLLIFEYRSNRLKKEIKLNSAFMLCFDEKYFIKNCLTSFNISQQYI